MFILQTLCIYTTCSLKSSIDNIGPVQIVEEPKRKYNALDLILTNRPNKVLRFDVLPGVSDHDIVLTEQDMRPVKQKQKPHQKGRTGANEGRYEISSLGYESYA